MIRCSSRVFELITTSSKNDMTVLSMSSELTLCIIFSRIAENTDGADFCPKFRKL